jgi:hypothetical protein
MSLDVSSGLDLEPELLRIDYGGNGSCIRILRRRKGHEVPRMPALLSH